MSAVKVSAKIAKIAKIAKAAKKRMALIALQSVGIAVHIA
jgi:hypothetical protein